ncbi:MAG: hypothetical protein ABIK44_06010 [candidate division WOR-3 bacterium]
MKRFLVLAASAAAAFGQFWTGPFQLTTSDSSDINPSVCKEWVSGNMTCLVWQTNRNGNWDIYSKFCQFYNGNGWGPEIPVSRDPAHDVNPVVAACNDFSEHPSFWCAWERKDSPIVGSIWVAFYTFRDTWLTYERVGRTINIGGDSAEPSMIVIKGSTRDTAWVIWRNQDTSGSSFISYCYHDGDSWSEPGVIAASSVEMRHARLGRGCGSRNQWHPYPVVTWEQQGDIYYSEYLNGAWSSPAQVAPSPALDLNPDVVSSQGWLAPYGWIVWQSDRDGDTAVFGTRCDTFSLCDRWCDRVNAGSNWTPAASPAAFTTDEPPWDVMPAWVSDRRGNPDIYSTWSGHDVPVDTSSAVDLCPTVTVMGMTQVWCCWQSNRSGNWDIFGSYIYAVGVEESRQLTANSPRPNAAIVRGVLFLPEAVSGERSAVGGCLRDISGRKVMELHPGPNDLSRLAPGVYFIQQDSGAQRRAVVLR